MKLQVNYGMDLWPLKYPGMPSAEEVCDLPPHAAGAQSEACG